MLRIIRNKAQTVSEFTMLIVVIIGALLAISTYVKRGIQGRWKAAVDEVGEQYDPAYMNTRVAHIVTATSDSDIWIESAGARHVWTHREDEITGSESQFGHMRVGSRSVYQAQADDDD